jgi:hypothetical protein
MIRRSAAATLTLPGESELPWLNDNVEGSAEYNEYFAVWWGRVKSSIQFAMEDTAIGGVEAKADQAQETATTASTGVTEIKEAAEGTGGGGVSSTSLSEWDGSTPAVSSFESRSDGGWPGPRIWALDGGTPSGVRDYALVPEESEVDPANNLVLITSTHSGGTA